MKVKLTEGQLKNIIAESIKKHLNENSDDIVRNLTYPPKDEDSVKGFVDDKDFDIRSFQKEIYKITGFLIILEMNNRFNNNLKSFFANTRRSLNKLCDLLNNKHIHDAIMNQEVQGTDDFTKKTSKLDLYRSYDGTNKRLTSMPDKDTVHNGYGYNPFSRKTEKMNIQQARDIIKRFFQEGNDDEYNSPTDGRYRKLKDALSHPFEFLNIIKNDDSYSEPEGYYDDYDY